MYYFDWTATTPISENSLNEYCKISRENFGNPSSNHIEGVKAKEILEKNRIKIAELMKVNPNYVYFTSGGTEADSIIIQSFLNSPSPGEILVSSIEHSAIQENKRIMEKFGWKFKFIPSPNGYLDLEALKNALNPKVRLVCVMKVNNVTGTIQNTNEISRIVREYEKTIGRKIHIHCDAVQALGKIPFYPSQESIDSAAFSSHKIYGPKGIGFLYNSNETIMSLSKGGGQESSLRPGTENLPAISAMTKAIEDCMVNIKSNYDKVLSLRNCFLKSISDTQIKVLSPIQDSCSPYILCISVKPFPSEVFLRVMSDEGFCLSAGSACSSNKRGKAEQILTAMKYKEDDRLSAIRISFSYYNTEEEVKQLAETVISSYRKLINGR